MADQWYRFDICELDAAHRRLLVGGTRVELQPRAFDLLLYLVEHAGRLVTKDELLDNVWGRRFVTESVIARVVMKVRKAIGDDAADPRFILTQYGTGYRFMARVERVAAPAPVPNGTQTPEAPELEGTTVDALGGTAPAVPAWRRYAWPLAAIAVVLMLASILLLSRSGQSMGLQRVAVLPIANDTGDSRLDWVELGLMSAIGEAMQARMPMDLIAPSEVLTALRAVPGDTMTEARLEALRSRLNANVLVLGRLHNMDKLYGLEMSIHRDGRTASVAELNDAHAAALVAPAAEAAVASLSPVKHRRLDAAHQLSADPYINEAYARALDAIARSHYEEAVELLRVVVRGAGDEAAPRHRLASSLNRTGEYKQALDEARKAVATARRSGSRSDLARSYWALATACYYLGQFECAQSNADQIMALKTPDDPEIEQYAYNVLGVIAAERGQLDEARRLMEAAIVGYQRMASPYRLGNAHYNLAILLSQSGSDDPDGAKRNLELALGYARTSGSGKLQVAALDKLADIAGQQGDCRQAFEDLDAADAVQRANSLSAAGRISSKVRVDCLYSLGRAREGLAVLDAVAKQDWAVERPVVSASIKLMRADILRDIPAHSSSEVRLLYEQAGALYKKLGMPGMQKNVLSEAAMYAVAHGRTEDAAALLAQARQLVDKGGAGSDLPIRDGRAMAAYYRDEPRQALELLQGSPKAGGGRDVLRTVRMAWILLDLEQPAAAGQQFGKVAPYEAGHVAVCLLGARLSYANGKYREAAAAQEGCIARLGDRTTTTAQAFLDTYRKAAADEKRRPLPHGSPQALWL